MNQRKITVRDTGRACKNCDNYDRDVFRDKNGVLRFRNDQPAKCLWKWPKITLPESIERQRLKGEDYATEYAIQTYHEHWIEHIYGGFAYGDDRQYIMRAWDRVVLAISLHIADEEGSKNPMIFPAKREEVQPHG